MITRQKALLRAATAAVALALTMSACGGSSDGSSGDGGKAADIPTGTDPQPLKERTTVTVSTDGTEPYAPFWVGEAMGEFEKENIDLKIEKIPATQALQAVLTGAADIVTPSPAGLFNAINDGGKLRIVSSVYDPDKNTGFYLSPKVLAKKPDFGPCDMKGLKVTVGPGSTIAAAAALPMKNYLAECDLTLKDIELTSLFGPDGLAALDSGALDVGVQYGVLGARAADLGAKNIVPFPSDFQFAPWVFGPDLMDKPEVATAVLRAMIRTVRTHLQGSYHDNPDVLKVLAKYEGMPEAQIADLPELTFNPDLAFDPEQLVVELQKVWLDYGKILSYDKPLTVDQVTDFSFLDRVVAK